MSARPKYFTDHTSKCGHLHVGTPVRFSLAYMIRHGDVNLSSVCDPTLVNNGITIEMFTYVMSYVFHVHKKT